MDINEKFEELLLETGSSSIKEASKWLKYSDLLLAKSRAVEKHGPKSAEVKKLDKEIKKEMDKLGITEEIQLNEAEEVDVNTMERKPRLSIKYWEKLFKAKAETAFDGIHGYIVILNGNTNRFESVTLDYLSKGPDYRWIGFSDRSKITIGF